MPQNVAHAFLRAVSPFVATSLRTGIPGGPGLLRLCSAVWNTQAKARHECRLGKLRACCIYPSDLALHIPFFLLLSAFGFLRLGELCLQG